MTTIIGVHGHNSNKDAFNYVKQWFPGHFNIHFLEYDSNSGFDNNLHNMYEEVDGIDDDLFFCTHSLGGAYAAYLANTYYHKTVGGVSISCPWLGSESAFLMQFMDPTSVVWKDVAPSSAAIRGLQDCDLGQNWTSIISTSGKSNLISGDNDGVLSYASMNGKRGVKYFKVNSTHMGVLLSNHTVEIIREALNNVKEVA